MKYNTTNIIAFSATGTTKKIACQIASNIPSAHNVYHDLLKNDDTMLHFNNDEIVIFGVPVYAGRVPEIAAKRLSEIKGDGTPAIIVCVYGNRDYDDALIELYDIVSANGFVVLSAGAFIGCHSIFNMIATERPHANDMALAAKMGKNTFMKLAEENFSLDNISGIELKIKGNRPYRQPGNVPLKPKTNRSCSRCGICAMECPVGAIPKQNPKETDKNLCISCRYWIDICTKKARYYGGLIYWIGSRKFIKNYSEPRIPYIVYR